MEDWNNRQERYKAYNAKLCVVQMYYIEKYIQIFWTWWYEINHEFTITNMLMSIKNIKNWKMYVDMNF